jgi:hypothetical protein
LHQKTAEELTNFLNNLTGNPAQQAEALNTELNRLKKAGLVKAYGWDNQDSDLWRLINSYQSWFYYTNLVETMSPEALSTSLSNKEFENSKEKLSGREQQVLRNLTLALLPCSPTPSGSTTLSTEENSQQLLKKEAEAGRNAYDLITQAFEKKVISTPYFKNILTRYKICYEITLSQCSHNQAQINSMQEQKNQRLQEESKQLKATLQGEIKNLKVDNATQAQSLSIAQDREKKLTEEKVALQRQIYALQNQINGYTNQSTEFDVKIKSHHDKLKNMEQLCGEQAEKIKVLEAAKNKPKENLDEKNKKTIEVQNVAKATNAILNEKLQTLKREIEDLRKQVRALEVGKIGLKTENVTLDSEKNELKKMVDTFTKGLKLIVGFFKLEMIGNSVLKERLKRPMGEKGANLIIFLPLQAELKKLEISFAQDGSLPTKPSTEVALPLFQKVINIDKR